MTRDLNDDLAAALDGGLIMPCFLVQLQFASETLYCWSGIGTLIYGGNSYLGVGSLGNIAAISEDSSVKADGTTLTLSGIDPTFLDECLTDIQLGAPALIYFGLLAAGAIIGAPYLIFSGTVDKPTVQIGADTISISLALENKLVNLQRAQQQRYTAADQQLTYPGDDGFNWVEIENDIALRWGS